MKVLDHKKFACFNYESSICNNPYELGSIVTRESKDGVEVGVVIQIHDDYELRTDMFGNTSVNEIKLSNKDEILNYRHRLIQHIEKQL